MNRSVSGIVVFVVVLVGIFGYKALFVDSDEVRKFNDSLVDMVQKSDAKFNRFTVYLDQYAQGQSVDVASMARMRDELEKGVKSDRDLLAKSDVPDDELCQQFHDNCLKYVDNSAQIVEKYKEVIDYISKHNPGSDADADAVDGILIGLLNKDDRLFNQVAETQKEMAKKFDFKLE